MISINVIPYHAEHSHAVIADFEEVLHQSTLQYSMAQLIDDGLTSREDFMEAFNKALLVCSYAGINPAAHFSQVYIYDTASGMTGTDWLLSREGLTLIIMQYPKK
jgi:hypothetical protein